MQNKIRPILIKEKVKSTTPPESHEALLNAAAVKLAAARSKKAIMDKAASSAQIFIIEES